MAGSRQEVRAARNENVFRQINERLHLLGTIASDSESAASDALEHFVCECFLADCSVVLDLTAAEYRSVRADGARFLIFLTRHIRARRSKSSWSVTSGSG